MSNLLDDAERWKRLKACRRQPEHPTDGDFIRALSAARALGYHVHIEISYIPEIHKKSPSVVQREMLFTARAAWYRQTPSAAHTFVYDDDLPQSCNLTLCVMRRAEKKAIKLMKQIFAGADLSLPKGYTKVDGSEVDNEHGKSRRTIEL